MKGKGIEMSNGHAPACRYRSDAEGSGVGNLIGLSGPERKRKAGCPTNSRVCLHMMIAVSNRRSAMLWQKRQAQLSVA